MKILVLNGPNLNMLGMREEDIYGSETLDDIEAKLKNKADSNECEVYFYQSNAEHELIDAIHTAFENGTDSIIFNPAGYTHTSVAIYDALLSLNIPIIEVHISNIYKREKFRHSSYVSMAANSVISGFGIDGYIFALESMLKSIKN